MSTLGPWVRHVATQREADHVKDAQMRRPRERMFQPFVAVALDLVQNVKRVATPPGEGANHQGTPPLAEQPVGERGALHDAGDVDPGRDVLEVVASAGFR
jgi:hypothetical protein